MQQSKLKRLFGRKHLHEQPQRQDIQSLVHHETVSFRGYQPTHPSILDDSFDGPFSDTIPPLQGAPNNNNIPPVSSVGSTAPNNPYLAAIEAKERSMTLAYLRTLPSQPSTTPDLPAIPTNDHGFGQRYQRLSSSSATATIILTNHRIPTPLLSGVRACAICAETLPTSQFPALAITRRCTHPPGTCLPCIAASIAADLASRQWSSTSIRCPECASPLAYDDVQQYADADTRSRYQTLSFRAAAASAGSGFRWCPAGCGSGQVCDDRERGDPRTTCVRCGVAFCAFHDGVMWHEGVTCAEYDGLLADAAADADGDEEDFVMVGLDSEEELPRRIEAGEGEDEDAREGREMAERTRLVDEMRRRAVRRGKELALTEATVHQTTKRCPGCRWPIEKKDGCSHMTCTMCSYEFCYSCGLKWNEGCRDTNCRAV